MRGSPGETLLGRRLAAVLTAPAHLLAVAATVAASSCARPVGVDDLVERDGVFFARGGARPFTGTAQAAHPGGGVREVAGFRDGRRDGVRRVWMADGTLVEETRWTQGALDGPAAWFHANGRPRERAGFRRGVQVGWARSWYEDGRDASLRHFVDGELDGVWTEWYPDGALRLQAAYRGGARHGEARSWHPDGTPYVRCAYVDDAADGECREWWPGGAPRWRATFAGGVHEGAFATFFAAGAPFVAGSARGGVAEGPWERRHRNGAPALRGLLTDGLPDGVWREWDDGGRLLEEGEYARGALRRLRRWFGDGSLRFAATRGADGGWTWEEWSAGGTPLRERDTPLLRGLYPFLFAGRDGAGAVVTGLTEAQRRTLASQREVSDYPLVTMRYEDGYGLAALLAAGVPGRRARLPGPPAALLPGGAQCSTFVARTASGEQLFAYNHDHKDHPTLVLYTAPPGGYRSVAVVQVHTLLDPEGIVAVARWRDDTLYLRAPFYPLVGMNERGVAVSGMSADGMTDVPDPRRPRLAYSHLLRLVLDHAGTVSEAVELIGRYAWEHAGGDHLMVADAAGEAAIVEFLGDRVAAFRDPRGWQVATNTSVAGRSPELLRAACGRYDATWRTLAANAGTTSPEQAMALLARIAMDGTLVTASSSVFNLSTRELHLVVGRRWSEVHRFALLRESRR